MIADPVTVRSITDRTDGGDCDGEASPSIASATTADVRHSRHCSHSAHDVGSVTMTADASVTAPPAAVGARPPCRRACDSSNSRRDGIAVCARPSER